MNCDSWLVPKNSLTTAETGLGLMRSWGIKRFDFLETHPLLDGPLHPHKADPVLVFQQLAHGANPPVAQMVDIVQRTFIGSSIDQLLDGQQDVFLAQDPAVLMVTSSIPSR